MDKLTFDESRKTGHEKERWGCSVGDLEAAELMNEGRKKPGVEVEGGNPRDTKSVGSRKRNRSGSREVEVEAENKDLAARGKQNSRVDSQECRRRGDERVEERKRERRWKTGKEEREERRGR